MWADCPPAGTGRRIADEPSCMRGRHRRCRPLDRSFLNHNVYRISWRLSPPSPSDFRASPQLAAFTNGLRGPCDERVLYVERAELRQRSALSSRKILEY